MKGFLKLKLFFESNIEHLVHLFCMAAAPHFFRIQEIHIVNRPGAVGIHTKHGSETFACLNKVERIVGIGTNE